MMMELRILIQSPLPPHLDGLTDLIDPQKDVDGFHPVNLGRIVQGRLDGRVCLQGSSDI